MALIIHRLAKREIRSSFSWYFRRSPRAAGWFLEPLSEAMQRIEDGPEQWPVYRSRFRWVKLRRFPYFVYFDFEPAGDIRIWAVARGSRRPGYWMRRK